MERRNLTGPDHQRANVLSRQAASYQETMATLERRNRRVQTVYYYVEFQTVLATLRDQGDDRCWNFVTQAQAFERGSRPSTAQREQRDVERPVTEALERDSCPSTVESENPEDRGSETQALEWDSRPTTVVSVKPGQARLVTYAAREVIRQPRSFEVTLRPPDAQVAKKPMPPDAKVQGTKGKKTLLDKPRKQRRTVVWSEVDESNVITRAKDADKRNPSGNCQARRQAYFEMRTG